MKFKLKAKLKKKKYSKHLFTKRELIYQDKDNHLHKLDLNNSISKTIMIHEDLTVRIASLVNNELIFYDENDRQFLLGEEWVDYQEMKKEDKKIHWLPFDVHCDNISFLPLYYHKSYNDKKLGFWNIITKETIWLEKIAISQVIVFEETCLIRRGDELKDFSRFSKFDLSKGKLIWDFNSKDIYPDRKRGFLDRILGIHNNQLLLQPRADRVIRLDIDTGKVISSISSYHHNLENVKQLSPDFLSMSMPKMDSKGILEGFFLRGMMYYSINENNEVKQLNNFRPGFPQNHEGWFIRGFEIDDEKIVFIGTESQGPGNTTIGIIDRNTREIVWTYIQEKNEVGYRASFTSNIYIAGKYFCISDIDDNIYIFEKEN